MAKMTKAAQKRMCKSIKAKSFKLLGSGAISTKCYETIASKMNTAERKL